MDVGLIGSIAGGDTDIAAGVVIGLVAASIGSGVDVVVDITLVLLFNGGGLLNLSFNGRLTAITIAGDFEIDGFSEREVGSTQGNEEAKGESECFFDHEKTRLKYLIIGQRNLNRA